MLFLLNISCSAPAISASTMTRFRTFLERYGTPVQGVSGIAVGLVTLVCTAPSLMDGASVREVVTLLGGCGSVIGGTRNLLYWRQVLNGAGRAYSALNV